MIRSLTKNSYYTGSPIGHSHANDVNDIVVLKYKTGTPRQSHNYIGLPIDLKIGIGDYVREVTSRAAKFGHDPMIGSDSRCMVATLYIRPCDFIYFFILQHVYSPHPLTDCRAQ